MSVRDPKEARSQQVAAIQVLVVGYGEIRLALPAEITRGILDPKELGPGGMVAVQGVSFMYTDLAGRLGIAVSGVGPESKLILCARGADHKVVQVDRLLGLADIEQDRVRPLPLHFTGPERDWFAGLFLFQEHVTLLLNARWLLTDHLPARLPEASLENRAEALPSEVHAGDAWLPESGSPHVTRPDY